ncbi:MAG: endonuclease/exonuclease/phosphatase family protein [Acidimicrobiia bacterium]|jgi:endonuclease/exonuclease/phosphatase family metal-dependent hydrolase
MAAATRRDGTIRIATWNLWWHFGPWAERQGAIVETMRAVDADVWCIQEVFRGRDGGDQALDLAAALGGYHVAHESRFPLEHFDESIGNAVLSRHPITGSAVRPLAAPDGLDELRLVVRADIETPAGPIEVFCTHLNFRLDQSHIRQEQVRELCAFVEETTQRRTFPPVVCGDFNADPDSDEIRMLTGAAAVPVPKLVFVDAWRAGGSGSGTTWDNRNAFAAADFEPDRRIDYVLVGYPRDAGRGQTVHAELVGAEPVGGVWPSDHFGVTADLRI